MKDTGITRAIDPLGRIVIPMELRKRLNIQAEDGMDISTDGNNIILIPRRTQCVFCGNEETKQLTKKNSVCICKKCIDELANSERSAK